MSSIPENPLDQISTGRFLTKSEVAEILNCSVKTVQRMVRDGEIRTIIIRKRSLRFDPKALKEDLERLQTRFI